EGVLTRARDRVSRWPYRGSQAWESTSVLAPRTKCNRPTNCSPVGDFRAFCRRELTRERVQSQTCGNAADESDSVLLASVGVMCEQGKGRRRWRDALPRR